MKSQLWICTGKSVGQDISSGNLNGLLEKVVLEDDETSVQRRGVGKNVLPILQNLARRDSSCMNVVICEGGVRLSATESEPQSYLQCRKSKWR